MLQPCDPPTHPDPMGGPQRRAGKGTCPPLGLGRLPVSTIGTRRPCPSAQDPVCRGLRKLGPPPHGHRGVTSPSLIRSLGATAPTTPTCCPFPHAAPSAGHASACPGCRDQHRRRGLSGSVPDRPPWAGISPTTQGNARRRPLTLKPHTKYLGVKSMPAAACCKILPERKKVHPANHGPPDGRVRRTPLVRLKVDRPPLNPGAVYTSVTHPQQSAGKAGTAPHPAEPEAGWRSTQAQALLRLAWKQGRQGRAGWELRVLPVHRQPEARAKQAPERHRKCSKTGGPASRLIPPRAKGHTLDGVGLSPGAKAEAGEHQRESGVSHAPAPCETHMREPCSGSGPL